MDRGASNSRVSMCNKQNQNKNIENNNKKKRKLNLKYMVRHLTFFQQVLISCMVTLSYCLIWQIISFILPPNEYGCVYACTTLGNIATLILPILSKKNRLFRWSSLWFWRVCTYIHTYIIGYYNPSSQDYWPSFSHHLCCVCYFYT